MTDVLGIRGPSALHLLKGEAETGSSARTRSADVAGAGRRDATRLTMLTAAITGFGLVIVLSASSVVSIATYGSPWGLFERQVMWTAFGAIAFLFCTRIDLRRLRRLAVPMLIVTIFLLVVVLAPHLGQSAGGSSRWIGAGPINLQPSEIAKLCFAIFAADLVARRELARDQLKAVVRPLLTVLAFMALLILKQPDMGTAIVLVAIGGAVLYAGGIRRRILLTVIGSILFIGTVFALVAPYRRARLFSFIDPFAHASTSGYQVVQSLEALGSGHLFGTGLGGSFAKWGFLPNAQTDFIFAVIGNELGLIGAVAVLLGFGGLGMLGLRIAARSTDRFSALLATGLTCWIVCQALINIGGVIGILPETGIPLPFLSFGGSSLVAALGAIGLLVNIAKDPARRTGEAVRPSTAAGVRRSPRPAQASSRAARTTR